MPTNNANFIADGNINPSTFVTQTGTSADNRVLAATANQKICGVAQEWTKAAPLSGASGIAAAAGDQITVYGQGDQCLLTYGATVTRGSLLKSDANGNAVVVTGTTVQNYGARALESGVAGDLHQVQVLLGQATAPAS
jgi:hypothetical protein